jgi:hypothetical protein
MPSCGEILLSWYFLRVGLIKSRFWCCVLVLIMLFVRLTLLSETTCIPVTVWSLQSVVLGNLSSSSASLDIQQIFLQFVYMVVSLEGEMCLSVHELFVAN